MEVNIHYAKTNLSQLLIKAEAGEEIIIARAGKPVVRLELVQPSEQHGPRAGVPKNLDAFSPELNERIARWFNESPLLDTGQMTRQEKAGKKSHKHGKHKK